MLIDSHCHLTFESFTPDEQVAIMARAREAGLSHMITIGAGEGIDGNLGALELARQHADIFCTVGVHPHDAKLVTDDNFLQVKAWAQDKKVRAIGEIGLDFHYSHSEHDVQIDVLKRFLNLARELKKNVVIHDRSAGNLTYDILKEWGAKPGEVMIHCFTGTPDLAKLYLDMGCFLSFTGIITFKKSEELRDALRLTPMNQLLIETDSPYLTPEPHRGKKNEPAFVKLVAEKVAQVRGLSFDEVAKITTENSKRFFGLV